MSHNATNWAIRQRGLKPATKIVLWHLCDRHNPDIGCFPSQDRLADDCEMSRSTLNVHLAILARNGLISRTVARDDTTKSQLPTSYRFAFEPGFKPSPESGHGVDGAKPPKPSPESGHGAESGKSQNPSPENSESRVRNPDTNSVREPVRREPERETRAQGKAATHIEAFLHPGRAEAFDKVKAHWPIGALDDVEAARLAWEKVPAAEWDIAANFVPEFVRLRQREGRTKSLGLKTYITSAPWQAPVAEKSRIVPTVDLKPYTRVLWAALWARVEKGENVTGALSRIRVGGRVRATDVPTLDEERLLPPEKVDSDTAQAWEDYCEKLGFQMPHPSTGIVFLPPGLPPIASLKYTWKAYALLADSSVMIGAKTWWWRLFSRGAPIADMIDNARRSRGSVPLSMGPMPCRAELSAMQAIATNGEDFELWREWFRKRHADLTGWPDATIWTPTARPPTRDKAATAGAGAQA